LFEEEDVEKVLMDTWRIRAAEIGDFAAAGGKSGGGGDREFLGGLDESERALFRVAHEGSKAVKVWMGEMRK